MGQLLVQVDVDEMTDPRRLYELTNQLARDLRSIRDVIVDRVTAPAGPDTKSPTVGQIGGLVLSGLLSAAGITALKDIVVAFVQRSGARSVTVRKGDNEVVLTGVSRRDLSAAAQQLERLLGGADAAPAPGRRPTGRAVPGAEQPRELAGPEEVDGTDGAE
ncbi:MAG TPA: hypothetical protein VGD43_02580 [Micromonospora sp.]